MLTEICIEALLADEELADQIQTALMAGESDDFVCFGSVVDCCPKL